jgi:hypothetical protein
MSAGLGQEDIRALLDDLSQELAARVATARPPRAQPRTRAATCLQRCPIRPP